MNSKGYAGDISALLYLAPFAISGLYAVYLWVLHGVSAFLPPSVYLTVTRDPIVFVAGTAAVFLGLILDESSVGPGDRQKKTEGLSSLLQSMAVASLVLALISALYANGFIGLSGAADDFIVGRFALVFPAMLVLMSYLITAKFGLGSLRNPSSLGMIALLLVLPTVFVVGRRSILLGMVASFVLVLAGVALLTMTRRKTADDKKD